MSEDTYEIGYFITYVLTFLLVYGYCIAAYGFLFGFAPFAVEGWRAVARWNRN